MTEGAKTAWTVTELLTHQFPPLRWFIEGILPGGLTLMWGSPKSGKSVAALQMLVAISAGGRAFGTLPVELTSTLYLCLEDGPRRLQGRLASFGAPSLSNCTIRTRWPRGGKGIDLLDEYLGNYEDIGVVVIDTLTLFAGITDSNDYAETVDITARLKRVADEHDIALIVVHHSRKGAGQYNQAYFAETALGSTGIIAGPDHLIYLERTPSGTNDSVMHFRSKDADDRHLALDFDRDIVGWRYVGEAEGTARTPERQEILTVLTDEGGPLKSGEIARRIGKKADTTSHLLKKLVEERRVRVVEYGKYSVVPNSGGQGAQSAQSADANASNFEKTEHFEWKNRGLVQRLHSKGFAKPVDGHEVDSMEVNAALGHA